MGKKWEHLIRSGESLTVEFKRQCPKLERLAKTCSAFSNSAGGFVFFGIGDDGKLIGLDHMEGTRELIDQVANFHCQPPIEYALHQWTPLPNTHVLILEISESESKPVYAVNPHHTGDAWPFFRSDKENLPLDKKSMKTMGTQRSDSLDKEFQSLDKISKAILEHLNRHPRQTMNELAKVPNISVHRAKKIMVRLEQKGWVHSFFNEKRREYSLAVPWTKR